VSFPLVGNPSVGKERFWTSQNDRIKDLKRLLISLEINSINCWQKIYESDMNLWSRKGHEHIRYSSLWKREVRRDFCGEDIIAKSPLTPLC
jgi:hypothetical protein